MIYGPIQFLLYPIPGAMCEFIVTAEAIQTGLFWPPGYTQAETLQWRWYAN